MKLKMYDEAYLSISDDSENARKVMQGFGYKMENGKLVVGPQKIYYDITAFENKINGGNVTKKETDEFLKELIKVYKKVKYNIDL